MQKLLISIVGPTATGKTAFALKLAEKFSTRFHLFDLISADSRQVFREMDITTGADVPATFQSVQFDPSSVNQFAYPYFTAGQVRIHGVGIRPPDQDWSVSDFRDFAQKIMNSAWQENNLPVLVGGTGLYHDHVLSQDQQLAVPPNEAIRQHAERISLANLQRWVAEIAPQKFANLNNSDRHNPRRLIRILEITLSPNQPAPIASASVVAQLRLGLTDDLEQISQRIAERISARLGQGVLEEVQELMARYDDEVWRLPAFSATGLKEIRSYLEDKVTYQQMQTLWLRREIQYAKRQLTWWKKQTGIHWFHVAEVGWQEIAFQQIQDFLSSAS